MAQFDLKKAHIYIRDGTRVWLGPQVLRLTMCLAMRVAQSR
jgi:hypothetical protein